MSLLFTTCYYILYIFWMFYKKETIEFMKKDVIEPRRHLVKKAGEFLLEKTGSAIAAAQNHIRTLNTHPEAQPSAPPLDQVEHTQELDPEFPRTHTSTWNH